MSLNVEILRILQEDAAFRAQFTPIEDLMKTHGLDQEEAEEVVDLAQRMTEQIDRLEEAEVSIRRNPVNWKKEGF